LRAGGDHRRPRAGWRRHVRFDGRLDAALPAPSPRLRSGERVGAVRRDAGRRDRPHHLLQRRVPRAARNAAVATRRYDCILATALPAASYIETVRSQYSTPYLRRILKPSSSHAPGMRKMAIVSPGTRPASTHPLMTPRATMSTRVFDTTFIITAIFLTPGLDRMSFVSSQAFFTLGLPPISQ